MATPSILIVPDRYKSGVLYSQLPESGAVDFDVTRATTAFRTNASGVLESVASGVPRLDYPSAGGCPSLLIEPAATNLILRSEEFNDASWTTVGGITIDTNATIAPDGTVTAEKIAGVNLTSNRRQQTVSLSAVQYTQSCYFKKDTSTLFWLAIYEDTSVFSRVAVDWSATVPAISSLTSGSTATIINAGNGWYRISLTYTIVNSAANYRFAIVPDRNNLQQGVFIWGAQLETGAVATSYIPTTSATVTRNADAISKSGVSGFIGQSAGTLYAEVDVQNFQANARIFAISDGTSDNRIALIKGSNSTLRGLVTTAALTVADIGTASGTTAGVYKIALAYAANDFVLYVNGSQIGTDTSGTVPACSQIFLGKIETSATTNQLNDRIRAAAIYTVRLSNTELAALTTL